MNFLQKKLFELRDEDYKNFQAKLLPTVDKNKIIGVRSPALKKLAKNFFEDGAENFLNDLPHKFFEENSIHALIISEMKNYSECLRATKNFLPYVDNWATCDSFIPKIFSKHTAELEREIKIWLDSEKIFTVRFAILMLMKFYFGKNFDEKYLLWVAKIETSEYYIETAAAWFFAEALVKQFDAAIIFLERKLLTPSVHKKTIQKAVESRRISLELKNFLRSLR